MTESNKKDNTGNTEEKTGKPGQRTGRGSGGNRPQIVKKGK